jgi:hypothetical protein
MEVFRAKLESLGYVPADWQLPVTEAYIADFERDYGLRLPDDYRSFLLECSGWFGSATCEFLEQPTPQGSGAWVDLFYGRTVPKCQIYDIRWATDSVGEAPAFVAIASGGTDGCMVVIRCGGPDAGHVYFFDRDQRSFWTDHEFRQMFPALGPLIEQYLERRGAGLLPPKPAGYENFYLLAQSFSGFMARLGPAPVGDG